MPYPSTTAGGGARTTFVPTQSPFADIAARNTWAAANLSDLLNNTSRVTVVEVTGVATYEWGGADTPSTYNANQWFQMTATGTTVSGSASPFDLLMLGSGGELVPSGVRRLSSGAGDIQFDETAQFPQESVQIGHGGIMSAFGAVAQTRSFITGRRILPTVTYWDKSNGTERTVEISLSSTENTVVQPDDSTAIPLSGTFDIMSTQIQAITDLYARLTPGTSITGFRFRATVAGLPQPFYYYPDRAAYDAGEGVDIADSGNSPNLVTIDIEANPIISFETRTITIEYEMDAGSVLGDGSTPYLEIDRNTMALRELAYRSELMSEVPSITSFNIQGQSTSVDAGTQITGSQTFNFAVENPSLVAVGSLSQDGNVISSNITPTDTSIAATVTTTTLTNAGDTTVFTLSFPVIGGGTITRTFTVRARAQAETLYYGIMATNIAASVDVTTLTMQDVVSGTQFNADFAIPTTEYAVILAPADRDITSIIERTFNAEIITDFVKDVNVRTISGQSYDAYVHQNNAGVEGTLATTITVG